MSEKVTGALAGIRVVDLSRYIAGPFCAMLLGDMGAEVIKVEKRGVGEDARGLSPFTNEKSLYFTTYNKNKKSVAIDMRSEKGMKILRDILAKSDVLIENFRPGTLEKMGFTKEELNKLNPRLIVTSVSGFGQDGPYKNRAAFDCIAQAMSGLMSLTGREGAEPMLTGTYIADFLTAVYSAFGTMVALFNREKTGEGQQLDIALLDSLFSVLATAVPLYVSNGEIQERWANRDKVCAPANAFPAKDGYIYIHGGTNPLFVRLANAMGKPELLSDPRFCENGVRMEHIEEIEGVVKDWLSDKTVEEAEQIMVDAGVPVSAVNDIPHVLQNPQINHRRAIEYVEYPGMGKVAVPGIVVKMSKTPGQVYCAPPVLGEHTEEVLKEVLGMSDREIAALREESVL